MAHLQGVESGTVVGHEPGRERKERAGQRSGKGRGQAKKLRRGGDGFILGGAGLHVLPTHTKTRKTANFELF